MSEADLLRRLRKALALGRLDFDTVVEKARNGECQFHEVPGAVGVTALGISGPYRTCYILAVAGEISGLTALEAKIDAFARQARCQVIETQGRRGWERVFNKIAHGYAISTVQYRKNLE